MNWRDTCIWVLVCISCLVAAGCMSLAAPTATQVATSSATTATTSAVDEGIFDSKGPTVKYPGRYFDFKKVLIAPGLSLNKDNSVVFSVGDFKAGKLSFDGRVEVSSLVRFFLTSMAKDGWEQVAYFQYPQGALFFARPGATCVINITESQLYTHVDIWLTPTRPR